MDCKYKFRSDVIKHTYIFCIFLKSIKKLRKISEPFLFVKNRCRIISIRKYEI